MTPLAIYPGAASVVSRAGVSVVALYGNALGGYVINPQRPRDQGISDAEPLFVDPTGPAALEQTATTVPLSPGQSYRMTPGQTTPLWVNAATAGHKFTAVLIQEPTPYPPTPLPSTFPPAGPTTLQNVIPSYLYKQYEDDDDLQAFVASFNTMAQNYVDTFNALNLPVYTGSIIAGTLLDWVAEGIYGMSRPALSSGKVKKKGPLNSYMLNGSMFNKFSIVEPNDVIVTTDDIFKRILTWHLYKGDGKVFNVRWLKRRIMRFLFGENGTDLNVDQTYRISISFGPNGEISIRLINSIRTITKAAMFNSFAPNSMAFNRVETQSSTLTPLPNAAIFQEAVQSGVLELPFQFSYTVSI